MGRRRKRPTPQQPTINAEADFERELEVFRTEAETAAQFFYAFLDINACLGADDAVYRLLNTAPLFWSTILSGHQTGTFVVMGQIFDKSSAHNLERLLRLAQDHPHIFSKAALAKRRQGAEKTRQAERRGLAKSRSADLAATPTPPDWLDSYLKDVYVPKPADFRRLCRYATKWQKVYLKKYQPLRHKVFAHRELSNKTDVSALPRSPSPCPTTFPAQAQYRPRPQLN
jgi:hypothetical protein